MPCHSRAVVAVAVAVLSVAGCQPRTNQDSATVFGITFDVITARTQMSGGTIESVVNDSAKIQISGVQIDLAKVKDGNSYSLTIDEKSYGTVQGGDKVVVSETRDVTVNGALRKIEEQSQH